MKFCIAFCVDSVPFGIGEISGEKSLGGSESACLGTARALKARGHDVHVFATKLADDCQGVDAWGVTWHHVKDLQRISNIFEWDVFCSLRMPMVFTYGVRARLRLLWNQDLMNAEPFKNQVMSTAWAVDKYVYVSQFHQHQWADWIPEIAPYSYVTKNGYDPSLLPAESTKNPNRVIHISRPERGLKPLLQMWPKVREANPWASLQICRYSSMYDASGWGEVCKQYDREVEALNKAVGGIDYLGELGKAALYQAISDAAVMWYPGVPGFAETSCLASIEAQACGTPFVGSYKGALPESVPYGILVKGDAYTPEYQAESVQAVVDLLKQANAPSFNYRRFVKAGKDHVEGYTFAVIAAEWEQWLEETFRARYEKNRVGVMRQLMHFDDHVAAKVVATEIVDEHMREDRWETRPPADHSVPGVRLPEAREAWEAKKFCDRVIEGKEQTSEQYAGHAYETLEELRHPAHSRLKLVAAAFDGCANVLDVACGNGAFALAIAEAEPGIHITAIDYAAENIRRATDAAKELGLSDRVTFICAPVWDFDTNSFSSWWQTFADEQGRAFDGLWVGEFVEHVADCTALIDGLEAVLQPSAKVLYTCPSGPMTEYQGRQLPIHRGHVHHFAFDDLIAVWGPKKGSTFDLMMWPNPTPAGNLCGNWVIAYLSSDAKAGQRNLAHRTRTTRPRPTLSVGIIARNAEHDILKCIDSVWAVADEIIVGDTGCGDTTRQIVDGIPKVRVIDVTPVQDHPDGFAGARNEVLAAATGEWFFWIDTDEVLAGASGLGKYLDASVYRGFAIYQNHLQLDAPMHHDSPVRLFKREPAIQFYGCVHEQPQRGDCNGDIVPALQLNDVQLAHTGYLVEGVRRQKMTDRNLPLLIRDQQRFPDRKLGKVLVLRDLVNLADYAAEEAGYRYPPVAVDYLKRAIAMFEQVLADPSNRYHAVARPYYERALTNLGLGIEVEMSLACKPGGLEGQRAKTRRVWVRQPDDLKRLMDFQVNDIVEKLKPGPLRVEPLEQPEQVNA